MTSTRWLCLAVLLGGCFKSPSTTTQQQPPKNCTSNTDCTAGNRCVSGACKPGCRTDTDCPQNGICHGDGTCGTRPQCSVDTDCPATFVCSAGRCACATDYSCWTRGGDGGPV